MRTQFWKNKSLRFGFSLIELLLTTLLILLLLAAVALNFSPWQKEASLREGAEQFQALLHLARAQAAETGHNVLVQFDSDTNDFSTSLRATVQLLWEPEPLTEPGVYQPLRVPGWDPADLNDQVAVVKVSDPNQVPLLEGAATELPPASWPPLHFYPDGSSDSAEIELAPRDEPLARRHVVVQLVGMSGSVTRRWLEVDELGQPVEEEMTEVEEPPAKPAEAAETAQPSVEPDAIPSDNHESVPATNDLPRP